MSLLRDRLVLATLIAAAVSAILTLAISAIGRKETARRNCGAVGFAAGFFAAYAWLEPKNLSPTSIWQWIPWIVAAAVIIGPIGIAAGVHSVERSVLWALFAFASAWIMFPTRPSLQPMRLAYVAAYAGSLSLFCSLLEPLIRRGSVRSVYTSLLFTSINAAALVAVMVSLRIGSLGIVGTVTLCGSGAATLWTRDESTLRGILVPWTSMLCSILLTAHFYDGLPHWAPVLIPVAPQMLWLFEFGPQAKLRGAWAAVAKVVAVGLPLAASWFV